MNGKVTLIDLLPWMGLLGGLFFGYESGYLTHGIVGGIVRAIVGAIIGGIGLPLCLLLLCLIGAGVSRVLLVSSSSAALRRRAGVDYHSSRQILAELARRGEPVDSLRQIIRAQLCSPSEGERWYGKENAARWQPDLLTCQSGPSVTLDPIWRTLTVVELAQAIERDGTFDRLPILADALEEAGCDNADILNHCRNGGEHVRGCWVVDLLLDRK
jgi:hypothetical protein